MLVKTNSLIYQVASIIPMSWNCIRISYARVGNDTEYTNYALIKLGGYK
jgi:hypothetical protein